MTKKILRQGIRGKGGEKPSSAGLGEATASWENRKENGTKNDYTTVSKKESQIS